MRVFIALEPGEEFLKNLLRELIPLKEKYPQFRWVPKEMLHVTLIFLGELNEELLPMVKEAAEGALGSGDIIAMGNKLFTIPPRREANVLALNFSKGGEAIAHLSEKIKKNLELRGIQPGGTDRKNFLPHITVARKGREPLRLLNEDLTISVQGVFSSLAVCKSELLPQGARYTALASYPLTRVAAFKNKTLS